VLLILVMEKHSLSMGLDLFDVGIHVLCMLVMEWFPQHLMHLVFIIVFGTYVVVMVSNEVVPFFSNFLLVGGFNEGTCLP